MICLILKQKTSWCVNPICQSAKSTNEQNKCFKKILLLLYFLEEAADFGCRISLSNGHSSWCVFLTESVDKLVKRLSHFKTIPKSSSNCFVFVSFVLFFFLNYKPKQEVQHPLPRTAWWHGSWVSAGPPLCSEHSLCSSSVLFSGSKVHSIHSLSVPSGTCTGWWAVISQLIPSSLPGLVTSHETILYKFSLKLLILSSIFRQFRLHRTRKNVWNKFRKQSRSHLNPLWSESIQAFHNICHSWRCDLKWCWLGF